MERISPTPNFNYPVGKCLPNGYINNENSDYIILDKAYSQIFITNQVDGAIIVLSKSQPVPVTVYVLGNGKSVNIAHEVYAGVSNISTSNDEEFLKVEVILSKDKVLTKLNQDYTFTGGYVQSVTPYIVKTSDEFTQLKTANQIDASVTLGNDYPYIVFVSNKVTKKVTCLQSFVSDEKISVSSLDNLSVNSETSDTAQVVGVFAVSLITLPWYRDFAEFQLMFAEVFSAAFSVKIQRVEGGYNILTPAYQIF